MLRDSPRSLNDYKTSFGYAILRANAMKFVGTVDLNENGAHLGNAGDSPDWYFAVGQYTGWGAMNVKTTLNAAGKLEYTLKYTYNAWDPYDWDPNKPGLTGVIVKELARLHLAGLARQFMMTGSVTKTVQWTEGDPLPEVPLP